MKHHSSVRFATPFLLASAILWAGVAWRFDPASVAARSAAASSPVDGAQFIATFDTPEDFFDRFQTEVFFGADPLDAPDPRMEWPGDHNHDCEGPDTTRTVHLTVPREMIWWCAPAGPDSGHVMTSMDIGGYAQVNFSPNRSFDDIKMVCWDQSQSDMGGRKWTQVVVVPEATYQANEGELHYVKPPLQEDVAVAGIHLTDGVFLFEMVRGSTAVYVGQNEYEPDYAGFVFGTDKARRFRHCITDLGDGTVRIELERETETETRISQGSFPDGPARVIFQDDNYNPEKDPTPTPAPFTWHWDNIIID